MRDVDKQYDMIHISSGEHCKILSQTLTDQGNVGVEFVEGTKIGMHNCTGYSKV